MSNQQINIGAALASLRPMDASGSCWSVCGDLVRTARNHLNKGPAIVIAVEIVAGIGRFKA